jgi:hypothetical protein
VVVVVVVVVVVMVVVVVGARIGANFELIEFTVHLRSPEHILL